MQQIERLLFSNRARLFYTLKETCYQLQKALSPSAAIIFPDFDDESVTFWRLSPTRHSIEACFLENFRMEHITRV